VDPIIEMDALERLWRQDRRSEEFYRLHRQSKWGDKIVVQVIKPLKRDEPQAVEDGIVYLEADPRYFRSGYAKMRIAAILKSKTLSEEQRARLRNVVLAATGSKNVGAEFKEYARLALVVADGKLLRQLAKQADTDDPSIRSRCEWILKLYALHGHSARTSR